MKRLYFLSLVFLMLGWMGVQAQNCVPGSIEICSDNPNPNLVSFTTDPISSTLCGPEPGNCSTLETEYLVLSYPDTLILGAEQSLSFDANEYSGCITVAPLCYNLMTVQALVDGMNNSMTCCDLINGIDTVNAPGACDSIIQIYTSGDQVQSLDDVLFLFEALGSSSITLQGFIDIVDQINANSFILGLVCGAGAIQYCVNPDVDFTVNAFDVVPWINTRTGTESATLAEGYHAVVSDALVDSMSNVIYRAGDNIQLNPEFEVAPTAEFLGEIVTPPCTPAAAKEKKKENCPEEEH